MAQQKKNKKIVSLPKVKKELKDFMTDDKGKMTRKDVAKLGVSLAVLGVMMQPGSSQAGVNHNDAVNTHSNSVTPGSPTANCAAHSNVTESVVTHLNHGQGGWMC
jgi:hypothetical protein